MGFQHELPCVAEEESTAFNVISDARAVVELYRQEKGFLGFLDEPKIP